MSEDEVLLEQHPERLRRHPFIFFFLFWFFPISVPMWIIAYIESKTEKIKITESRIIYRRGIISKDEVELAKDQVKQATVEQGMLDRVFNMGTLSITTGGDVSEIAIRGFYNPSKIKKLSRE